ncbi:hypothetical protein H2203_004904 [Taxawa tesnikishii (nom. ined.)]|nr:hypothetical protein H2203_004904 [Dothideales sp. JES 119]
MPFSHHSHSGQFCGHASNTLEEMVQRAISLRMASFALTEHMPRSESSDLYPEEISAGQTGPGLFQLFDAFVTEAKRLRERYRPQIQILIGFEGEWIRPSFAGVMGDLMGRYEFDFFVGSVHHVHGVPIDFDHEMYYKARDISGGSDEALYRDYFDAQYAMLKALKPPVVGHFDLIRLKSDDPERSFETVDEAWTRILRNLEFVASYGGSWS